MSDQKYEYSYKTLFGEEMQEDLDKMSFDGWRVVSAMFRGLNENSSAIYAVIYEREKARKPGKVHAF